MSSLNERREKENCKSPSPFILVSFFLPTTGCVYGDVFTKLCFALRCGIAALLARDFEDEFCEPELLFSVENIAQIVSHDIILYKVAVA